MLLSFHAPVLEVPETVDPTTELKPFGHYAICSSCKHVNV